METNQSIEKTVPEQADSCLCPEENLRQFYLQEARMMCPSANESRSERAQLEMLRARLKRLNRLLVLLDAYPWSESNALVQKACGFYMVEAQDSKKDRLVLNQYLADRTRFMGEISVFYDLISHMQLYYKGQYDEIGRLLNLKL